MTLEQLVTDLATSQELRDKGFPQDTAMVWVSAEEFDEYEVGENREPVLMERTETLDEDGEPMYEFVAAPTAGELMEWLKNLAPECAGPAVRWEPECWMADFDHEEDAGEHAVEDTLIAALAALVLEVAG